MMEGRIRKKETNLLFVVLPLLAVSYPRVPTSVTPEIGFVPSPTCSRHWDWEARGTNLARCTYEFLTHQIAPKLLVRQSKRPQQ